MEQRQIDVLIVDPFISAHEVDENDNSKIQQAAALFVRIAGETNAAVEIVHHVKKGAGVGKDRSHRRLSVAERALKGQGAFGSCH